MAKLAVRCGIIRRYVLSRIVDPRMKEHRTGNMLDSLLKRVEDDEKSQVEDHLFPIFSPVRRLSVDELDL
jgi:hypothetical protein